MTPDEWDKCRERQVVVEQGEQLPPHADEAEQGVLGCLLRAPMELIPQARQRLKDADGKEFYDLRNRKIWMAFCRMYDDRMAGRPICSTGAGGIDLITVHQRLKDYQNEDDAGGWAYLAELPDKTPSEFNLAYYLEIVAEKFARRMLIGLCFNAANALQDWGGPMDQLIHKLADDLGAVARAAAPPGEAIKLYVRPVDVGDELYRRRYGKDKGEHGLAMPEGAFGDFPFLIRTRELTLLEAETKMGKSTMLSYIALHLANQGMRIVIDSREVHYIDTLNKLAMQLTGRQKGGELCAEGERQARENDGLGLFTCECAVCRAERRSLHRTIEWLNPRVCINRTTGIRHWREVLDAFYELAREGWNFFALDSLMRLGIEDDDFTQQGMCVSAFAQFSIETNSATWIINHRNKGTGDYRHKSGGSYKVAANASNICSVVKNEKKFEKLAPGLDLLRRKLITYDDFKNLDASKEWLGKWDAKFYVHDQRADGTRSNAARELWFLKRSGQYFDHRSGGERPQPVNWLDHWMPEKASGAPGTNGEPGGNGHVARSQFDDVTANWPKPEVDK